jgi:hypothetical protein
VAPTAGCAKVCSLIQYLPETGSPKMRAFLRSIEGLHLYIDAELSRPAPRRLKYVPKENPTTLDPVWLCILVMIALTVFAMRDFLSSNLEQRNAMAIVFPFLLMPFALRLKTLLRQKRVLQTGAPVPALLNMIPIKLWWPKDWLGYSGVIYEVQAKYEYEGKTYVVDCLAKDPTQWRGKYVSVMVDPKKPSKGIIYQICSYQVE